MKRELKRLANESFDILVVGAGIHGATIASLSAASGFKVALIDQGDFGAGTSANSQKIIHGGLRYLQHLNVARMRDSIAARRTYLALAPHLVRPLRCVVPTQGRGLRSRPVMAAALLLNDVISLDRNNGVGQEHRLPSGYTLSASECRARVPGLEGQRLSGGAVWFDALAHDTERLTLGFVEAATADGACAANYVRALRLLESKGTVGGAAVEDAITKETFDVRASLVVNAMGPSVADLIDDRRPAPSTLPRHWCRAMNIVITRRLFGDYAVGLPAGAYTDRDVILDKGSRDYFFVPWRESTIIGTFYDHEQLEPGEPCLTASDIHRMLDVIDTAYPAAKLQASDVGFVHTGWLPEASAQAGSQDIQLLKSPVVAGIRRSTDGRGLLTVLGVKYTTAPQVAKQVVRYARAALGSATAPPTPTDLTWGQWQMASGSKAMVDDLDRAILDRLGERYGAMSGPLLRCFASADHRQPVGPGRAALAGEVVYAVREEMALRLADVIFRRTDLGSNAYPGRPVLLRCAEIMARELAWSPENVRRELSEVEARYAPLFEAGCYPRSEPAVDTHTA